MSRLAPFVDAAAAIDRTSWDNTFISYYTFGAASGPGARSVAARSVGRPDDAGHLHAGVVGAARTSGPEDAGHGRDAVHDRRPQGRCSAEVSGDPQFAQAFFARYIQGHEVVDYASVARARRD